MIQSDSNFLCFLKCYRIFDKKSSYYLYRQVSLFLKIKLKLMTSFVNALKIQNITKKIQKFHLKEYLQIHNSPKSDDSNHIIYSRCHEECKNKNPYSLSVLLHNIHMVSIRITLRRKITNNHQSLN